MTTEDTKNTEGENDLQCELTAWELLREAERERDEARHKLEICMAANSDVARIAKECDKARGLLASEKITRDHIIKRGIEMQKERDEARAVAYDLAVIASHCLGSHGFSLLNETSERIADTLKRWMELK